MTERRYLEDFDVGQAFESTEEYAITPDNLREYASEYDPQAIHLDPEVAEREMFGGIVASGWHSLSVTMRLMVRSRFLGDGPIVGVAINNLRFVKPVRPGDRLKAQAQVLEIRPSRSDPGSGYLVLRITTLQHRGQAVLTQDWTLRIERTPAQLPGSSQS